MRKRTQKLLSMSLVGVMTMALVSGCGGGTDDKTADKGSKGDKTITVSVQTGDGVKQGWEAVAKAYEKLHPDVNVEIDLKPVEGYGDWVQKVFTSDNPTADIVNINLAGTAAEGRSIDYYEYADKDSPYSDGKWIDQFDFEKQKQEKSTWDALSLDSVQVIWLYNKEIFKKAGVQPPKTWDELIGACKKIQAAGYQPISVAGDFNSFWSEKMGWLAQVYADQTTRSMINTYRAQEGDYCYDKDIDGKWKYNPADPYNDDAANVTQNPVRAFKAIQDGTFAPDSVGMKTVWQNLAKVFPGYAGGDAFFGTSDGIPLFYQGKAAMTIDGAWRIINYKNDMEKLDAGKKVTSGDNVIEGVKKFDLGTFNMPSMEGKGIEAPARTLEVANGFLGCISKNQKHNDLVMDFLMYYSSKEGMSTYLDAGLKHGFVPSGMSLVYGVEYPADIKEAFSGLKFIGNCQKGSGCRISRGLSGLNGDIQESYRQFYDYAYKYLSGKINVDEFLADHKKNIMQYLPEALATSDISKNDLKNPQNEPTGE